MSLNDSRIVYEPLPVPAQPVIVINNHVAPSGVAPVLPVAAGKDDIHRWAHRAKITSYVALTVGVTSMLSMVHWYFTSRHITEAMLAYEADPKAWMEGTHKPVDPNAPVSHAYFALYDILKTWCFYGALASMSLAGIGCKSLQATKTDTHNSKFTHRALRCGVFKAAFLFLMGMIMNHSSMELKAVVESLKKNTEQTVHHPRNLAQWTAVDQEEEPVITEEEPVTAEEPVIPEEAPKAKIMPDFGFGKEHHKPHHKRHGGHCMSMILGAILGVHFYFMHKMKKA